MEISRRLQKIAEYIPQGSRVADIGSDHAYLPTYLVGTGRSTYIIAGELNDGPYLLARNRVKESGLEDYVQVRKGDGLEVIAPGEVDTIVIAGMGGSLITRILSNGMEKLEEINRLVLQPNVGEHIVRRYCMENGWKLIAEEILEEEGKIYEILCFIPGDGKQPYEQSDQSIELLLRLGPFLIERQDEVFRKKWFGEIAQMEQVIKQLTNANSTEARNKKEQLEMEIEKIRGIIK
jgi:tRNA (adenine22-N1)-methyltransferase